MKDEELLKEAEKNILNLKNNSIKISGKPFQISEGDYRQGYLDGAEPREKKIEELEESNIALQELVQQREQRGLEVQEDLLKEKEVIEKENEKLDKQIDTMLEDCKRCTYRKTSEQLEQAKKLLEKFCSYYMYDCDATRKDYEAFEELKKQAGDFIKE